MTRVAHEHAAKLRDEAGLLLERSGLGAILRGYGRTNPTGAYALDLMAWRTIDIDLVLFEMWDPLDAFFALGHQLAKLRGVCWMSFGNHLRQPAPGLPGALYWGVRMLNPDTEAEWKINLWAVDEPGAHRNAALVESVRKALDDNFRRVILGLKHALLKDTDQQTRARSFLLYEAVLFEGLRDEAEIRAFLRKRAAEGA